MASSSLQKEDEDAAPIYTIPSRRLGALEHPMVIKNLDKGIKTFGQHNSFQAILDSASPQISVPLYLRYDNPAARPLTSHNALTHNVVVKVTVPKRTGRKRKRGTDGPWEGEVAPPADGPGVLSRDRLDKPGLVRRKLQDNVGKYTVEPIGVIKNTHRYRGLADFQYALGGSKFMQKFVDKVLPGDVAKLKEFSLQPGIESGTGIDLIPPPYFTPISLPFGYNYSQNPHTKEINPAAARPGASGTVAEDQEWERIVNITSRAAAAGYFIGHNEYPVPSAPRRQPDMSDPQVAAIITEMRQAMAERPIWTRRSMWNRLGAKFAELPKNGGLVRHCLQYAGYQFKGGPWRDALVRYGLDPRSDPKYRVYQTLIFKLHKTRIGSVGRSWQAVRRKEIGVSNFGKAWEDLGAAAASSTGDGSNTNSPSSRSRGRHNGRVGDSLLLNTHIFDGEAFSTDGKVWQVCDITDPLLARLFAEADVRSECDVDTSGFYPRVLWSVAKAIMKCKMVAIRFNRALTDADFSAALEVAKSPSLQTSQNPQNSQQPQSQQRVPDGEDAVLNPGQGNNNSIGISLPDLKLTEAEYEQLRGGGGGDGSRQQRPRPGVKSTKPEKMMAPEGLGRRRRTHYRVRIPLKEAEEREAVKMIRLLTQNAPQGKEVERVGGGVAGGNSGEDVGGGEGTVEPVGAEDEEEEEGGQEVRGGGALQEILEDMEEEEGSEDEEEEESDEDGEDTVIPGGKRRPFEAQVSEDEADEEEQELEEGGYSDEDDQEGMEDEEDEDEDGYGRGEGDETVFDEEGEYYDEEGEGFPQPWEE